MKYSHKLQLDAFQVQNLAHDDLRPTPPAPWPEDEDQAVECLYQEALDLYLIKNAQMGIFTICVN